MIPGQPNFSSTYEEMLWLRARCGYDVDFAMARTVWERCAPADQAGMLRQYRAGVEEVERSLGRYAATHGDVW